MVLVCYGEARNHVFDLFPVEPLVSYSCDVYTSERCLIIIFIIEYTVFTCLYRNQDWLLKG